MNRQLSRPTRLIATVALPLLFTFGCANTSKNLSDATPSDKITPEPLVAHEENSDVNETVKQAIHNMDSTLSLADQKEFVAESLSVTELNEEAPEMTVLVIEEGMDIDHLAAQYAPSEVEIAAIATESENAIELTGQSLVVTPAPEKKVFHFAFNKNQPTEEDQEILQQHAEHLLQNPSLLLIISGHTDSRGNSAYNQHLSEQRAKNIAATLIAEGVHSTQLRVTGVGDTLPMTNPKNWHENRRVELLYQDSMVASRE